MKPATCGAGSRSEQFLKLVSRVLGTQSAVADGQLQIVLSSGDMVVFQAQKQ